MEFRPVSLEDAPLVRRLLSEDPQDIADLCFSYEFAHSRCGDIAARIAVSDGCAVYLWHEAGEDRLSIPFGGGDRRRILERLALDRRERGLPFVLTDVPEAFAREFPSLLPGAYSIDEDRDEFDYIYTCEGLADLRGRNRQDRRRMIHRFEDTGAWSYAPLTTDDLDDCRRILSDWMAAKPTDPARCVHLRDDNAALNAVLDNYADLEMVGGILRQKGEPVAFAVGEPLNARMMLVAFERALPSVRGASAMINREFVRRHCDGFEFVNRTCDGGDAGLRKVKLEYRPVRLERKFIIRGTPRVAS